MRIFDQAPAPDYWGEVETRASTVSAAAPPDRSARSARLLVAALLAILTISAAIAVGSGAIELPWPVESTIPSPSAPPPSTSAPASPWARSWMTGRELMDVLAEEFGYLWFEVGGNGQTAFSSVADPGSNEPAWIFVDAPVDTAAEVYVVAHVDFAELASQHVDRVTQLLSPDEATWMANALDQGLMSEGPFSVDTMTESGGYVDVTRVDEDVSTDLMVVRFLPVGDRTVVPGWCGGVPIGPPGEPGPRATPDPRELRCIAVENHSGVDMTLIEGDTGTGGRSRLSACTGMTQSGPIPTRPWSLRVGRADPELAIAGPVLASFDSSQLTGDPPYLLEVVVNADLTATIGQRLSLPEFIARNC
jgi:hypothetical protein